MPMVRSVPRVDESSSAQQIPEFGYSVFRCSDDALYERDADILRADGRDQGAQPGVRAVAANRYIGQNTFAVCKLQRHLVAGRLCRLQPSVPVHRVGSQRIEQEIP